MMKSLLNNRSSGSSLLEVVVYVTILGILLVLIVNILMVMLRSFAGFQLQRELNQSAIVTFDRLTRELRQATSVDLVNSTLGTHPGRLVLNGFNGEGEPRSVEFYLNNGTMVVLADGLLASTTGRHVTVSNLIFYRLITPHSEAVRVETTFTVARAGISHTGSYTTTAVLRNAY